MAETPTTIYDDFCDESATLEATIATLEAAPSLDSLDTLSAAKTRLDLVKNAMPGLCQAKDAYEAELRYAALLQAQGPRWESAAGAKVSALADVATRLAALFSAIDSYNTAHGTQMAVLTALGYSREFRIRYSAAPASLQQILISVTQGDRAWMAKVPDFDPEGITQTLPFE